MEHFKWTNIEPNWLVDLVLRRMRIFQPQRVPLQKQKRHPLLLHVPRTFILPPNPGQILPNGLLSDFLHPFCSYRSSPSFSFLSFPIRYLFLRFPASLFLVLCDFFLFCKMKRNNDRNDPRVRGWTTSNDSDSDDFANGDEEGEEEDALPAYQFIRPITNSFPLLRPCKIEHSSHVVTNHFPFHVSRS